MPPPNLSKAHIRRLTELLSLPTAPFAEHLVIAYIEAFCRKRSAIRLSRDAVGNMLLRITRNGARKRRPVCITAHLDHPGFVAKQMLRAGRLDAYWRGGVPPDYFVGTKVRFWVDERWRKGRVQSIKTKTSKGRKSVESAIIDIKTDVPPGAIGMWDLPEPRIRGSRIHARACDDLAGAAAMLCALDDLCRTKRACDAFFLFTRAEEVGFVGATAACRLGTIPRGAYLVAMETSAERSHVKMGDGPILRVGDLASTFSSPVTAYCRDVATDLARRDKKFTFQRKLMDGGTCESSAFCTLGFEATGMCLALGNYHNVDGAGHRIAPEYVDLNDFRSVVRWFVALACSTTPFTGRDEPLAKRVKALEQEHRSLLTRSLHQPR